MITLSTHRAHMHTHTCAQSILLLCFVNFDLLTFNPAYPGTFLSFQLRACTNKQNAFYMLHHNTHALQTFLNNINCINETGLMKAFHAKTGASSELSLGGTRVERFLSFPASFLNKALFALWITSSILVDLFFSLKSRARGALACAWQKP